MRRCGYATASEPSWSSGSEASGSGFMQHVMSTAMQQEIVDMTELAAQWSRIRARLQTEVGEVEYRNWLRQITLGGLDGDEVVLLLPTRFLSDWVRSHYGDRLTVLWRAENAIVRRVDIRI